MVEMIKVMACLFWMHQHHEFLKPETDNRELAADICNNLWNHSADEEFERRKLAG